MSDDLLARPTEPRNGGAGPARTDATSPMTTAELIERILQLERQGQRDEARISELEGRPAPTWGT